MGWLILIAIVVVGFIVAGSISGNSDAIKKAKEQEQFAISAATRCEAYVQYLRRTSTNPRITAMTDVEINDFVMSNIRAYKEDFDTYAKIGALIFFGGCIGSMLLIASAGWDWVAFISLCVLSGGATVLFVKKAEKDLLAKYQALDLEVARLEVK